MARTCDLTGKRRLVANNVSHANNKTKTKKQVNIEEEAREMKLAGRLHL